MEDPHARNGVGSLIQVNAKSTIESEYMYGDESLESVFENSFKRYSNFDKQPLVLDNSKAITKYSESDAENAEFNETIIFNVDTKKAEMIGHLMLQFKLPEIKGYQWTNDIGHAMIDFVKIINGDEELVTYTGQYLHMYGLLCVPKSKHNGYSNMIGHYCSRHSLSGRSRTVHVPLPFFETREDRQYFPLFISNSKTFQIVVKIKPIRDLVYVSPDNNVQCMIRVNENNINLQVLTKNDISIRPKFEAKLLFDTFYLTKYERHMFVTRTSQLLYQFVQERRFRLEQDDTEVPLQIDFSHTVSAIILCVVPDCAVDQNLHFMYEPLKNIKVVLNGVVVNKSHNNNDKLPASKYRYMSCFNNIPNKWVYVIPFCLSSDQTQPTGYFTFDAQQNKKSVITIERENTQRTCTVYVYALTYNKLTIENGIISSIIQ